NIRIATANGFAQAPATVTIPAGAKTATFTVTGVKSGVEELTATPSDASYETAFARVQVAAASQLTLRAISGPSPIVVSLTDVNGLFYAGARIVATAGGGTVSPLFAVTDATGQATFRWLPGEAALSTLTLYVEAAPSVTLRLNAGSAAPTIDSVVNGASFLPGMAAGSIDTLFGVNLGEAVISLNGATLQQFYRDDKQINFYVPATATPGPGTLTVTNAAGVTAGIPVTITAADPGIFPGAVVHAGTVVSADTTPVTAGDYLEIYCTGLGPTRVSANGLNLTAVTPTIYIGSTPLLPAYSGLAPGFVGLYQIDVQIPAGLPAGRLPLIVTSGQTYSNEVKITVR
ncbi:MAG: hypothetical protein JWP63_3050, partial [Candidatus Solibacter sp.]|nr:hypothetical protein [Candidatus Solibacter sp.]